MQTLLVAYYFTVMLLGSTKPMLAGPYADWSECSHVREWLAAREFYTAGCDLLPYPQPQSIHLEIFELPDLIASVDPHAFEEPDGEPQR